MSLTLTAVALRKAFPSAKMEYVNAFIENVPVLERAGILENDKRLRHFLAQGAAETSGFTITTESGNYSADGLLKIFPKYFKSRAEAKAYAKRPEAIFNRTYGGRLGNTAPGDGYRYRGRGVFQITGKAAYKAYGERLGIDLVNNPDKAADPLVSVQIAVHYWSDLSLNTWADNDDILAVSRGINGGNPKRNIQPNGMPHRKGWYSKITKSLSIGAAAEEMRAEGTLKEGDQGSEVERLQSALRAKGYPIGAIDGIYGAATRRAVTLFKAENDLEGEAGIWLAEYWPALENAANIQENRQETTAKDLHQAGDPVVTNLTWSERLLKWLGLGALVTGGASSTAGNFPELVTQYQPVIEVFRPAIQFAANNGWILVAIAAFALWFVLRGVIGRIAKAYRHGDYQGQYKEVK